MENVGTKWSTTEGISAVLVALLGVAKSAGWIPADMEPASVIAAVVLLINLAVSIIRKVGRKGSVPFVSDAK